MNMLQSVFDLGLSSLNLTDKEHDKHLQYCIYNLFCNKTFDLIHRPTFMVYLLYLKHDIILNAVPFTYWGTVGHFVNEG